MIQMAVNQAIEEYKQSAEGQKLQVDVAVANAKVEVEKLKYQQGQEDLKQAQLETAMKEMELQAKLAEIPQNV